MSNTRVRLIAQAVRLFQARGYHGVGVAEILAAAEAPKGSLYHHFPSGKAELAAAAVDCIAEEVNVWLTHALEGGVRPAALVPMAAVAIGAWLEKSQYRSGALIGALANAELPEPVRTAVARAYAGWRAKLASGFHGHKKADALAALAIAALEGGFAQALAAKDKTLLTVAAEAFALAASSLDAKASPP
jgi:TetR/AcrR family transcriptional repressor of lmrAB and yxaGH operons